MSEKPTLRLVNFRPSSYQGQPVYLLTDELVGYQLRLPPLQAQIAALCNGERTLDEIYQKTAELAGIPFDQQIVADTVKHLDEAYMLDNERFGRMMNRLRSDFHKLPARPARYVTSSVEKVNAEFAAYGAGDDLNGWEPWQGRGIISPHIDYQRGGRVYAKVWERAIPSVLEADMTIIFGTDHKGGSGTFTLTKQPYATPYGVLPTEPELINELAAAIGPPAAFAEELHHRTEHSIELTAVWLHRIYHEAGVAPKPMIPILVGSFHHFTTNGGHPAQDPLLMTAIETLREKTAAKKVVAIASVDLAHMGPLFDHDFVMDNGRRSELLETDHDLIDAIAKGDAESFYDQIAQIQNFNNVCGFSPIYLTLKYLGETSGVKVAYEQCPADTQNHSLVSICGMLLK